MSRWKLVAVTCLIVSCSAKKEPSSPNPVSEGLRLLITTSDYTSGALAFVDLVAGQVSRQNLTVHADAIVRAPAGNHYYVVNRLGQDNIQVVDKKTFSRVRQFSVGAQTNPQDIAVYSDSVAFVSLFNSANLLKVDPSSGPTGENISLADFSDSDGSPEPSYLYPTKDSLWVTLQRLDMKAGLSPSNDSYLAFVSPVSLKVQSHLVLKSRNPVTDFKEDGKGHIFLGCAGKMGMSSELDGAIEKFDIASRRSLGVVSQESQLGGDIVDFEILENEGVAIVASPLTKLVTFSLSDGHLIKTLWEPQQYSLSQLRFDAQSQLLYVADRDKQRPGIVVYDTKTWTKREDLRFDVGLPPYQMVLSR